MRRYALVVAATLLSSAGMALPAAGQSFLWTASTGDWDDPFNWNIFSFPNSSNATASLPGAAGYSVFVDGIDIIVRSVTVSTGPSLIIRNNAIFTSFESSTINGRIVLGTGGNAGTLRYRGATLNGSGRILLNRGTTTVPAVLDVSPAGNQVATAQTFTIGGIGTLVGSLLNAGTLNPGLVAAYGDLSVSAGSALALSPTSRVQFRLSTTTDFDRLVGPGAIALGGTLTIQLDGSEPTIGDAFAIISGAAVTGTFATTTLPSLTTPKQWSVDYSTAGSVVLRVTVAGPVCYPNCDGSTIQPILNPLDFSCFLTDYRSALLLPEPQQITSYANCDGSTTGPVLNALDFACFLNRFRAGCR